MKPQYIFISLVLPFILNIIITPIIISYAHKKELFDATDHRKTHVGNIPRLAGIGIFISTFISSVTLLIISKNDLNLSFLLSISIIFLSGIIDDIKGVRALVKLIAQITVSLVLILSGNTLSHVFIPFINYNLYFGIFQYPITIIWIIGITNAINLLDGMDGQAGGVSALASLTLGIISALTGYAAIAIVCFVLTGALSGFLKYNFPPAKIFMGDSGSLTVGFFLSAIPLLYTASEMKGKIILVAIAILLIPIFDVFAAMIRRTRLKISFFEPDRGHIHHKFIDFTSLNTRQILFVIYSICIISGTISILFITKTNTFTQIGLFINLLIHSVLFAFLHHRKEKGEIIKK